MKYIIPIIIAAAVFATNVGSVSAQTTPAGTACTADSQCLGPGGLCVVRDTNNPNPNDKVCRQTMCGSNSVRVVDAAGSPTGSTTLSAGQFIEISSTSTYGQTTGYLAAFYNKQNLYTQNGTPKGIHTTKAHLDQYDVTGSILQPDGNYPLVYNVTTGAGTTNTMKIPYAFFNTGDLNTTSKAVATQIQVNSYFSTTNPARFSVPEANCVKSFTLAATTVAPTTPPNSSCPAQSSCTNQSCACNAGYYNCDNNWSNGCEKAGVCNAGGVCTANNQCSSGVCKDHICQPGGATAVPPTTAPTSPQSTEPTKIPSGGSCTNTDQCSTGYACMGGKCIPTICDGQKQCPGGYTCKQGVCFPGTCDNNNPCVNGYNCSNGMCLPSQCRADQPCPPGYSCQDDGSCTKTDTLGQCTEDAQCKANGQCINNNCFCKEGTYNCDRDWADGCEATAPCQGSGTAKVLLKVKFNGIGVNVPPVDKTVKVNVILANKYLRSPIEREMELTETGKDDKGISIYEGSFDVNNIAFGNGYSIYIKGDHHLQKRICDITPTEIVDGRYVCTKGDITLKEGENILDFSDIYQLAGDIPISNAQSGFIDAVDVVFIRSNFQSTAADKLIIGDLNKDGIIDTQDYALAVYALSFKYDEGIEEEE